MSKQRQANQHVILKGTGDKSQVTNFGAAKEVKNCRLVILLPADLRVEITAKSKRNGGSHIVANGYWLCVRCGIESTKVQI